MISLALNTVVSTRLVDKGKHDPPILDLTIESIQYIGTELVFAKPWENTIAGPLAGVHRLLWLDYWATLLRYWLHYWAPCQGLNGLVDCPSQLICIKTNIKNITGNLLRYWPDNLLPGTGQTASRTHLL